MEVLVCIAFAYGAGLLPLTEPTKLLIQRICVVAAIVLFVLVCVHAQIPAAFTH